MSDATKLPTLSDLTYFKWTTPSAENPKLSGPISASATTIAFTSAPKDKDGNVITAPFIMGIRNKSSYVETVYCPNGADGANGLSATGCIRGIDPSGIDYTTGDSSFADEHEQGAAVFCSIPAVLISMVIEALQGNIATGGSDFIIGTDADGTVTISRSTGAGTYVGWVRFNTTTDQVQYSNNGSTWINIADVSASDLVKVSANDTTPGYLNGKLVAGDNITLTEVNDGGDETLRIAASSQRDGVTEHIIYTPAYLTGGSSAEGTYNNWLAVLDGEFTISIDGSSHDITGIDFTGVTSMDDVASYIQTAIRTATGSTETVVWSTDHFVISSVDTTSSSAITVTSTVGGGTGTDISGAGASDWMDSDTGNGTVTAAALDKTADAGKVILLDATGLADNGFTPTQLWDGISSFTKTNAEPLTDGSDDVVTHEHPLSLTQTRQCLWTTDGVGSTNGAIVVATLTDNTTDAASHFAPFYRPTGYNISSVKIYINLATAVTGNLYVSFDGSSYAAGSTGAITTDNVALTTYAVSTGTNDYVTQVTVPTAAYTNWSEGDYCYFKMTRANNAADTLNQDVLAICYEVTFTLA